jgi:hypothetical protein
LDEIKTEFKLNKETVADRFIDEIKPEFNNLTLNFESTMAKVVTNELDNALNQKLRNLCELLLFII